MNQRALCILILLSSFLFGPTTGQARYLNSNTGRFQTMDSYEGNNSDPVSLHKYLYCHDNPVNRIDPSGHETEVSVGVANAGAASLDAANVTATAVARAFATRRLQNAAAKWTISTAVQLAAVGITIGGYEIHDNYATSQEFERITTETEKRSNPTLSPRAYENFECDTFVEDAKRFFTKEGKNPQIIRFDAYERKIRSDTIWARLGLLAGRVISSSGYHEGCLVDGVVYDNNLPFGVPRRIWEKYGYRVAPADKPVGIFISFRQAHNWGYAKISPP